MENLYYYIGFGIILALLIAAGAWRRLNKTKLWQTEEIQKLRKWLGKGPEHSPYGTTHRSLFCELPGRTIHYVQAGQGPHLVLVHGIAASLYIWRFMLPELTKHYTVTALDLPGFGFSSKETEHDYGLDQQAQNVVEFLDKIGIEETFLMGSSMGGAIVLWMAKNHPHRFKKVGVISPSTNPKLLRNLNLIPRPLITPLFPLARSLKLLATPKTARVIYSRVVSNHELMTEETISAYLRPFLETEKSVTTLIKATRLIADARLPHALDSLAQPVLILWGKRDRLVPGHFMEELVTKIRDAELHAHPTAGHHAMEDDPQWVLEHARRFFK